MKILNKLEFKKLLNNNPTKKFVFFEWTPRINLSDFHISSGNPKFPDFEATVLNCSDADDIIFDYDWSINEYADDELFAVLSDDEIKEIINLFSEVVKEEENNNEEN